jgi:uncharacterized protein with NAD-binding domain and iron-sulfur cluster
MLELVLAPAAKYMSKTDEEILQATLEELERLFPAEILADGSMAKVVKFSCVRTPTSVYETLPGMEEARPTNLSPISTFFHGGRLFRSKSFSLPWKDRSFLGSSLQKHSPRCGLRMKRILALRGAATVDPATPESVGC